MDRTDALLRLHHAAANAGWLRDALFPPVDTGSTEAPAPSDGRATDLLHAPLQAWTAMGAPPLARDVAWGHAAAAYAERVLAWRDAAPNRHVVGWNDADYPSLLREAPSPPTVLFVEGHLDRLWWPQLAIVGSRAPTPAGRERAALWARAFADAGYVVTSGLASGIDAAAHGATLRAPGTIAVTGTGLDRCFPASHRGLQAAIAEQGAVVTEHPPGTDARAEHFPSRNRIIAGLSLATVVVEAAQRSGALITARLAAESGRDVFALPGAPENLKARGCHRLIREGATLVDDPGQVLDAMASATTTLGDALRRRLGAAPSSGTGDSASGRSRAAHRRPPDSSTHDLFRGPCTGPCDAPDDDATARVHAALAADGAGFDELLTRSGLTPTALAPILLAMELEGRLTQQHGVYLPCGSAPPTRAGLQRRR